MNCFRHERLRFVADGTGQDSAFYLCTSVLWQRHECARSSPLILPHIKQHTPKCARISTLYIGIHDGIKRASRCMVQHFLTWLDRNIGFDVDPDHARTRPGRFISRSFFSCGLTTKVHAPRVSMILAHHSRPATSTMTLFSFRYAARTPPSRKDSKKECEEIFDEAFSFFFFGAWWKESKGRFWQRSLLLVDNSLYY